MGEFQSSRLRDADLFHQLDEAAFRKVVSSSAIRHIEGGVTLLKQGDRPEHLFVVVQGRFKIASLAKNGSQKTLRFMEVGEVIGCAAVFRRVPYPATATAVVPSAVMSWTAKQFDALLREYPQLATNALSIVGGRTTEMLDRLREATTESVEQRIARAVIRLANRTSVSGVTGPIELRISRQELAELSDTSLFTVSRTISAWSRAGILKRGRERITLIDLKKLEQAAVR
jgi:CRP/FNR family transcriptional regulator, nitrogen oxide reductase regulator